MHRTFLTAGSFAAICFAAGMFAHCSAADAPSPGATRIAKWKDDKKAALMLFFDDSMPSHVKNVMPELKGRGLVGTFYVNSGSGHYQALKEKWDKEIPALGMEYGNHTYTHKGVRDMAHAEEEFGKCSDAIVAAQNLKRPCLISFGKPGVKQGDWNINDAQLKELLAKHNLIMRTNVNGRFALTHLKTAEDMLKIVDKVIADGGMDCVAFHGVGGEWLSISLPIFVTFINGVMERREQLWIAGHIAVHKYDTERSSAEVKVLEAGGAQVRLKLSCKADPQLYDMPLTLITQVPASWQKVQVAQGAKSSVVPASNGTIKYDALPGEEAIVLKAAPAY